MFSKNIIAVLCLLFAGAWGSLMAQTRIIPAPPQSASILILGATAHLGNGEVIDNAAIGFDEGKLTLVSDATTIRIDPSQWGQVIDAQGKHVYPGFILPASNLGLVEVSSLGDTEDGNEQGNYNPSVRSIIAYNTDSEAIPTMRFNGILMAQAAPQGGVISGRSSVVQLDAWNWEDAAYHADDALHLNWPSKTTRPRWWLGETGIRPNPNYEENIREIEQWLADAKAYEDRPNRGAVNLHLEAMEGLFDGSLGLFVHTNSAKSMIAAVNMARRYGIERVVIVGGGEALLVKDFLIEHDVPVILENIHSLPERDHEDTVLPYKLPAMLHEAGVEFCISYSAGPGPRARSLPFTVGTAVAHGLPYEKAIQAVTGGAARILGIGNRTGTLETGKDATLFVSNGDALDMRSNQLEHAFIQGRAIQLEGRQQFLYQKYSEKYGHEVNGNE